MTRHAKNCTASSVYTYHEKKKDSKASGYGSYTTRLGKDAVKDFDCCCLTLHPCRNPVVTPEGYIYDKEAILEYILKKKKDIAKQKKLYEQQKNKEKDELKELAEAEQRSKAERGECSSSSVSNMHNGRDKKLPSFWIPSLTPGAKANKVDKPDSTIYCPMSQKPLKLKDLVDVKFTPINDPDDKQSLIVKKNRYMCVVTHDILGNSVPCAVLKPSGDVVTMECVEKLIKKDMLHPISGIKLEDKDIISVQMGGTGFSSANDTLSANKARPVMQA